jgi:uncharacterized membrane protein YqiK
MLFTIAIIAVVAVLILPSIRIIGPNQVGLVLKRFAIRRLRQGDPVAFHGEAGYQADLLMPGWRFRFWIIYGVEKHPWVQVSAGEIGVVIAQVGSPLPIGAKSSRYRPDFANFTDIREFVAGHGEKGLQRPVLPPGSLIPVHPVGFLVLTSAGVYGVPIDPDSVRSLRLTPERFQLVRITPEVLPDGTERDVVGIVTTFEGDPLSAGDIASRIGGFDDIRPLLDAASGSADSEVIERLLGNQNMAHASYQDYQAFIDHGGKMGLQHDPLLYGAYALNPFLVSVEVVPMLVVKQGEVAVIKGYVGLPTQDVSGAEFKHGSLVRPGRRGIWKEPLRTGKYPLNPRIYEAAIVPTRIVTLNWADAVSAAHKLDAALQSITAKSREGFVFHIDLQVQIHVPDTMAPKVISMVGSMQNLVSEVLQAAVGNHFRDTLQAMQAVGFIEMRQQVQESAFQHIAAKLKEYEVETRGVYIQDVTFPVELVKVLTEREIARQEIETYAKQEEAQRVRVSMEAAKGTAEMQAQLAQSAVGVDIKRNNAEARKAEAAGESAYIEQTGNAKGAEVRAVGLAQAEAYRRQVEALGPTATAIVNAVRALAEARTPVVPQVFVAGGQGGSVEGLAAGLIAKLGLDQVLPHPPAPEPVAAAAEVAPAQHELV